MTENDISYKAIGAAIEIHKSIGPGLLESAYENALAYDSLNFALFAPIILRDFAWKNLPATQNNVWPL